MKCLIACTLLLSMHVQSQELTIKNTQGGIFSLGVRTTTSVFEHQDFGISGSGYGGQFRIQLSNRLNTEWFFDYMKGNIQNKASRTDYHVGWSVMYYFTDKPNPVVKPYILAGHCFDRTELYDNSNRSNSIFKNSSAIQAGGGVHFNLSPRMDITLISQYMFHLGKDVHAHIHDDEPIEFERHNGTGMEGHLLVTVGLNYKIADIWNKGRKGRQ